MLVPYIRFFSVSKIPGMAVHSVLRIQFFYHPIPPQVTINLVPKSIIEIAWDKFAKDNKVPGGYRESGEFEILKMNWKLYRDVARADPVVGAPSSRGYEGQQGGIIESANSPAASMARASQ